MIPKNLNNAKKLYFFSLYLLFASVFIYWRKGVEIEEIRQQTKQQMRETHDIEIRSYEEKMKNMSIEYEERIAKLKKELDSKESELRSIKNKTKTSRVKIVHPDGRVEEREMSYAESSYISNISKQMKISFEKSLKEIESRLDASYKEHIESLNKEIKQKELEYSMLSERINKKEYVENKSLSVRVGLLNKDETYIGFSKNILGGFYLDFQLINDKNMNNKYGLGVGIDF